MMKGKGFSSCLMCNSQNNLLFGNQLALKIIQARYETDNFDVMLQNTKICIKCIGRLQQLNEFFANTAVASSNVDDAKENDKKECDVCQLPYSPYELIPSKMLIGVDLRKWLKNHEDDEEESKEAISCYSCYYLICLYNETKDQLTQLLDYFYKSLNNCKVTVKDCGQNVNQVLANFEQEQFFGSLLLTPVEKTTHVHRNRVSFAPDVEIIPETPTKRQRMSQRNSNIVPEPVILTKIVPCENVPSINNKISISQNTRHLRNSTGSTSRVISPAVLNIKKARHSTGSMNNTSNLEALKKMHNIVECYVKIKRLALFPAKSDKKNENKGIAKKKSVKIKLNAKSRVAMRRMNRSLRSDKNQLSDDMENSMNLEVVLTQNDLNNSQSSTISNDPLNASINEDAVQNDSSLFSLDETLPVISPTNISDADIQIKDEDNNNEISLKENLDASLVHSTRKTRNSAVKLAESKNVAEKNKTIQKRKTSNISPKKEVDDLEPESCENVEMIDDHEIIEYSPEEPEENLEQSYLLEIEFLNPIQYNNKVIFNSTAANNEDENELLSTSQENFMALSSEDLEMNAEYLDESLEETLMNTRNSPQNDALCPIYTMDQLLNEDSLLS